MCPDDIVCQPSADAGRTCDLPQSIQSRYATVRSLRAVSNHLFPESRDEATDLRSPVERSLFEARILAIRLLADDDEDQRDEAAALVGETAGRVGLGVESDVQTSSRTSLTSLIRIAKRGSATSDVSTDRAWAWMSWYYGLAETQAANQQEYTLWEDFVSKQLQPSEEDLGK